MADSNTEMVKIDMPNQPEAGIDNYEKLSITIQDVGFNVKIKDKSPKGFTERAILKGISGVFQPGRMVAVMGSSGAGKTSLLNVLAGEISTGTTSGKIMVNGKQVQGAQMKELSAFCFQEDIILSTMTVREAVMMSAILRLPNSIPYAVKVTKVDEVLATLRLTKAQNTVIGDAAVKGISGGERKRTALAMELVCDPAILFLDEPTSSLDSFSAFLVCDILKKLAQAGRTVVATIHQPSSDVFHMFDDLMLLAEGRIMYYGPVHDVVPYFASLGYKCPNYTNPADFIFMNILNSDVKQSNQMSKMESLEAQATSDKQRIADLLAAFQSSELGKKVHDEAFAVLKVDGYTQQPKYSSDFFTQFRFLLSRAGKNAFRNKFIIRVKFMQTLFISLLMGLIYLNSPRLTFQSFVQNIAGALFFICVNGLMNSSIGVLSIFAAEKNVVRRESGNGYYSITSYFWSKILVELPHQIIFPFMQTVILFWMIRFENGAGYNFLIFALVTILLSNCGSALGIFFASVFQSLTVSLAVTPMCLLPLMIFSGLFVNNNGIPVYFDWIKYLSPIKYCFEALMKVQFQGYTRVETNDSNVSLQYSGDQVLKNYAFDSDGLTVPICLLIVFGLYVALLLLAYLALLRNAGPKSRK